MACRQLDQVGKKSLVNRMIMKGGFREIKNMENMYYHPERDAYVG